MAILKGTGGSVTAPGLTINVTEWSATYETEAVPIPPTMSADPPIEHHEPGVMRFSGSLRGKADTSAMPLVVNAAGSFVATVTLTAGTNAAYSGEMLLTNVSITRRLADAVVTADFRNYSDTITVS